MADATTGYSGTPLPKKLGIKPGHRVLLVGAPAGFAHTHLEPLPPGVTIHLRRGVGAYDVIVGFATTTAQLGNVLATNIEGMPVDGALWVAWPKQTSGVATELTGDVVRRDGLAAGVVDVKVCAIDATWSGLKFVFRLADRVGR